MSIKSTKKAINQGTPGTPRGSSGSRPAARALRVSAGSSPIRRGQQDATGYATKVRKLVQYQDGRLESILLPMLVTSAMVQRRRIVPADHVECFDDVPVVIDDGDAEYHDYAASSEEDEGGPNGGGFKQQRKQQKKADQPETFIETLLHALDCKTCDDNGCRKMRLVLGHFLSCRKARAPGGQDPCGLCQQLIAIVAWHAASCDARACPVPMCNALKAAGQDAPPPKPQEELLKPDVALKREALDCHARVVLAGPVAGFI